MNKIRILSWNVNGIRAVYKKGFLDWLLSEKPDILCLQETKASEKQIPEAIKTIEGHHSYFSPASKKGYSGVALFTKQRPKNLLMKFGIKKFDTEGRVIIADYGRFLLFNIYFPNGKASEERLHYKIEFYEAFLHYVDRLRREGKKLIICGDVNTAHREIDLARPKENSKISGFLPEERAWIDTFISHGFIDTFRVFHKASGHYTWWDVKSRARERNVGWRIDYFFISDNLKKHLRSSFIMTEVMGSDHCPVGIEIFV
ncbi:exodeoxyribonuclease III [candidate division TA06 bacterium DG_78]|uniref:Exodeoxyribonuclease III n=1 Tax=candidate division TA06 bacterium DG_78 TaxID=1703772 RepID=A0A0S7YIS5_UNCT6|nr:MAG: exodeoxyribonuclease III [candidate division TA06 bacterium DG_78]